MADEGANATQKQRQSAIYDYYISIGEWPEELLKDGYVWDYFLDYLNDYLPSGMLSSAQRDATKPDSEAKNDPDSMEPESDDLDTDWDYVTTRKILCRRFVTFEEQEALRSPNWKPDPTLNYSSQSIPMKQPTPTPIKFLRFAEVNEKAVGHPLVVEGIQSNEGEDSRLSWAKFYEVEGLRRVNFKQRKMQEREEELLWKHFKWWDTSNEPQVEGFTPELDMD